MEFSNELLDELIGSAKTATDVFGKGGVIKSLTEKLAERMLQAEMTEHLGYEPHESKGNNSGNSRNGYTNKKVKTEDGELNLKVPRDRNGTFDPILIEKNQRRLSGFNEKVISLYALGTPLSDIQYHMEQLYDHAISIETISKITDEVLDEVNEWQNRPLQSLYTIVYFDALVVKVREGKHIVRKSVYVALGVDIDGKKDVLGLWINRNEGASFWLNVISDIQSRGVDEILISCVDGLKGFPEALRSVYPYTEVQVCIVHMIRNSFKYVPRKNSKEFMEDLKLIYKASTRSAAEKALERFSIKWEDKYPTVVNSWNSNWPQLSVMFDHSDAIRKLIYTTNPIESLNASIRKVTKLKRAFPNDESVFKQVYLAIKRKVEAWKGGIQGWREIRNQLEIKYGERIREAMNS